MTPHTFIQWLQADMSSYDSISSNYQGGFY